LTAEALVEKLRFHVQELQAQNESLSKELAALKASIEDDKEKARIAAEEKRLREEQLEKERIERETQERLRKVTHFEATI